MLHITKKTALRLSILGLTSLILGGSVFITPVIVSAKEPVCQTSSAPGLYLAKSDACPVKVEDSANPKKLAEDVVITVLTNGMNKILLFKSGFSNYVPNPDGIGGKWIVPDSVTAQNANMTQLESVASQYYLFKITAGKDGQLTKTEYKANPNMVLTRLIELTKK